MTKLKPCPFCGEMRPYTCICGQKWAVRCDGCGALVISDSADDGGKSAAKRWNARAAEEDRRTVRTCRMRLDIGSRLFVCSECGHWWGMDQARQDMPSFCPNCGRKVER